MRQTDHSKFILTPISDIIADTITACRVLGGRMETYPLKEYVFQTTFLKMTGASEQKLKCICWELATYDYEYRREVLNGSVGECSSYKEKKDVFANIFKSINRLDSQQKIESIFSSDWKKSFLSNLKTYYANLFKCSPIVDWDKLNYISCVSYVKTIKATGFCNYQTVPNKGGEETFKFLETELQLLYEDVVYRHRNRCAHNLKSYQSITPSLGSLARHDSDENNYFKMFFVLILLDEIFIRAFGEYVKLRKTVIF